MKGTDTMNALVEWKEQGVRKLCLQISEMPLDSGLSSRLVEIYKEIEVLKGLEESQWIDLDRAHKHLVNRLSEHIAQAPVKIPDWIPEVQFCVSILEKLPRFGEFEGSHFPIFTSTQDLLIEILARTWGKVGSEQQATQILEVIDSELKRPLTAHLPQMLYEHMAPVSSQVRLFAAMKYASQKDMCTNTKLLVTHLLENIAS